MPISLSARSLPAQLTPSKLESWIAAGLKKLYPGSAESVLLREFFADLEGVGPEEQDRIWADLVRQFEAIGHRISSDGL